MDGDHKGLGDGCSNFLGAAFTIMAFNNDVSVGEVFDRFYQQVMVKEKPKLSEIEIFYCL